MSDTTFNELAVKPSTPGAGQWRLYMKAAGLFILDDLGTETGPFVGGAGGGDHIVDDLLNASAVEVVKLLHSLSAGGGLANMGVDLSMDLTNSTPANVQAGRIRTLWRVPTGASEDSNMVLSILTNGGLVDLLTLDGEDRLARFQTNDNVGRLGGTWSQFTSVDTGLIKDAFVALIRTSSAAAAAGLGGRYVIKAHNSVKIEVDQGGFATAWIDPAAGAEFALAKIQRRVNGTIRDGLTIEGAGVKVHDGVDETKKLLIDVSAIAAATERKLIMPDQDVDLTPGAAAGLKNFVSRRNFGATDNTTTSFVQHGTALTIVNPAGVNKDFLVFGSWQWTHDASNSDFICRLDFNGISIFGGPNSVHRQEPKDPASTQQHFSTWTRVLDVPPGNNTLVFLFRSSNAGDRARMTETVLTAFQVD